MVFTIISAKDSAGMIDDFLPHPRIALQEVFEIIMFIEIPFVVDELGVVAQLAFHLGVILKKTVKLPNFIAQPIMIAPGRCG